MDHFESSTLAAQSVISPMHRRLPSRVAGQDCYFFFQRTGRATAAQAQDAAQKKSPDVQDHVTACVVRVLNHRVTPHRPISSGTRLLKWLDKQVTGHTLYIDWQVLHTNLDAPRLPYLRQPNRRLTLRDRCTDEHIDIFGTSSNGTRPISATEHEGAWT